MLNAGGGGGHSSESNAATMVAFEKELLKKSPRYCSVVGMSLANTSALLPPKLQNWGRTMSNAVFGRRPHPCPRGDQIGLTDRITDIFSPPQNRKWKSRKMSSWGENPLRSGNTNDRYLNGADESVSKPEGDFEDSRNRKITLVMTMHRPLM